MGVLFVIVGLWLVLGAIVALVAFLAKKDPGEPVHLEELEPPVEVSAHRQ